MCHLLPKRRTLLSSWGNLENLSANGAGYGHNCTSIPTANSRHSWSQTRTTLLHRDAHSLSKWITVKKDPAWTLCFCIKQGQETCQLPKGVEETAETAQQYLHWCGQIAIKIINPTDYTITGSCPVGLRQKTSWHGSLIVSSQTSGFHHYYS